MRQWETVSTIEELLDLMSPEYSLVQHCLRKKALKGPKTKEEDIWRNPREAAFHTFEDSLHLIIKEMQKTGCRPREVLLDVSKEYPESTNTFYMPHCVSVYRCGGCCNNEAFHCVNTSHTYINKTLVEMYMPQTSSSVIVVNFINHTACECQTKRPIHSIIRRSAATGHAKCAATETQCAAGLLRSPVTCQCEPDDISRGPLTEYDPLAGALSDFCGPNKVWDEEHCECVCYNGLTHSACGEGRRLDGATCECVCAEQVAPEFCPPKQKWDEELCGCVCTADCPKNQPLNPENCQCECKESLATCMMQGKKFNPETCSCYRFPCRTQRKCTSGYYYSHYVCQCLPNFMKSEERY
ncbi:vascular endothelial growth factor C isoform X2 [Amia ocellicauda]|uniref:vascular endothelial growth factor C isoform X2 n=1 Tax=Amia ocellicauda TaxID=2972642 RepID=UPI0034643521